MPRWRGFSIHLPLSGDSKIQIKFVCIWWKLQIQIVVYFLCLFSSPSSVVVVIVDAFLLCVLYLRCPLHFSVHRNSNTCARKYDFHDWLLSLRLFSFWLQFKRNSFFGCIWWGCASLPFCTTHIRHNNYITWIAFLIDFVCNLFPKFFAQHKIPFITLPPDNYRALARIIMLADIEDEKQRKCCPLSALHAQRQQKGIF